MKLYQALHLASPPVAMQVSPLPTVTTVYVALLTGHAKGPLTDHGKYNSSHNSDTIAYYMGIKNLLTICENLRQAGKERRYASSSH